MKKLIFGILAILVYMECEEFMTPKDVYVTTNTIFMNYDPVVNLTEGRKHVKRFKNEKEIKKYISAQWQIKDGEWRKRECEVKVMTWVPDEEKAEKK